MPALVTYFDPQPASGELPARLASPFSHAEPHVLARRAAAQLPTEGLREGKMFGVLVVADSAGRIGFVRGFSGMFDGRWEVPGFVPPVFGLDARAAFWPAGEAELGVIAAQLAVASERVVPIELALAALRAAHARERAALRVRHQANRLVRRAARDRGEDVHALDQASRGDTAEERRLRARHESERTRLEAQVQELVTARDAIAARRAERSRGLLVQIQDTYVLASARGEHRTLRELFAPDEPPGGAGDCAAPKLLAYAYRHGLRPLALAERWCGPPPPTGGRHAGTFYPACRGKCGPILAHMLDGLATEAAPSFGLDAIAADEPAPVFEDDWVIVVAKPCGLLSVPGRGGRHDSVLTRLRARHHAPQLTLVHRLDLDTSGLLLAAKDPETHAALQAQFARREVEKRYIAWLDGEVAGDHGTIDLALRVDLDDRPRQIHDPIHGRQAITEWRVLAREPGKTRVAFAPRTGRTHQLRVHAAHPQGLATPIAGDRLYGRANGRLMLHAESLALVHPHTNARLSLVVRAPF